MKDVGNFLFGSMEEFLHAIRQSFLTAAITLLMLFAVRIFWPTFALGVVIQTQQQAK